VEARIPFLGGRVEGLGRLLFLPVVAVTGLDQPDLALTAGAGLAYQVGPVSAELSYVLERYDFPTRDGLTRAEQLSTLTVSAGARLFGGSAR
jgi:hypothetical protein